MKYKVGDKVRVRQWKAMEREFGVDEYGNILTPKFLFFKSMANFCGKIIEIYLVHDNYYSAIGFGEGRKWTDEMFEGYAFEYGDEIEVSDDGKNWVSRYYLAFVDGHTHPYYVCCIPPMSDGSRLRLGMSALYKYARPIQKTTVEIKILVNGKEVNEPLSLETAKRLGVVR